MVRTIGRKLLWGYALLMLIAAFGYARYDTYMMDGDGTAFMDIAQDLQNGHRALAINGYWNPGYPALLATADTVAKPSLWRELVIVRYTNIAIFAFAMAGCVFFTIGLARTRFQAQAQAQAQVQAQAQNTAPPTISAVPDGTLHLLGLALLVLSLGRELPIAAPRADTLLLALLLLAMGLVLRLRIGAGLWAYPLLGITLGCAYLTKSFAFLPSALLIIGLFAYGAMQKSRRILMGAVLTAAVFALTAGPYILAISHQLGHLTTGDSARLNYAFFIDNTARWHEWFHHTLGHAAGPFTHPEAPLTTQPPVFSFAAHPYGTFPLWFDPAWWTAGLKPHVYLAGHLSRLLRNCVVFVRFLLGRPEPLVLLAVICAFGAGWSRLPAKNALRTRLWALAPILWGLLMLGIYFPIDLQDRYLTGPFLLILLPLFALLEARAEAQSLSAQPRALSTALTATALIVLFAGISLSQAATYLAERRRQIPTADQRHPGFDPDTFSAAAALDQLGLHPGDKIACMGDRACYVDHYWARLAGAQILAEIETPNEANPETVWDSITDKRTVTAPLKQMGLKYIVARFSNAAGKPAGWIQLGHTDFFAYPLQASVAPEEAAAIAAFQPAP